MTDDLDTATNGVSGGVLNETARAELLSQLSEIRALYAPPGVPSTGVTAEMSGIALPGNMALAEPIGKLYIDPRGGGGGGGGEPPPAPPAFVHVVDVNTLTVEPDRELPTSGGVQLLAAPAERPEAYALVMQPFCVSQDIPCSVLRTDFFLARIPPLGVPQPDAGSMSVPSPVTADATAMVVTPPAGATSLQPDTAYAAFAGPSPTGVLTGTLDQVQGIRDFSTAQVSAIDITAGRDLPPRYVALAPSPAAGSDRLYALHSGAIDAIETTHQGGPLVHADEIVLPLGFDDPTAMASGVTASGKPRLYVSRGDALVAFDLPSGALKGPVALPDSIVALHLSRDKRFLLATRHPSGSVGGSTISSVVVLDADTLEILYDSETAICTPPAGGLCPSAIQNPMSLTIDGSHAFSSKGL